MKIGNPHEAVIQGIYCLLHDEKIVYIGQSNSIIRRVGFHLGQNRKVFNQFSYLELPDRRDDLEYELIEKFRPKYNILGNPKFWTYEKSTWDRKNKTRRSKQKKKKRKQTKKKIKLKKDTK